jgi:hypothetical protein
MFIDTYWGKIILWSMHVRGTMHADDRMQEQWSMHAWMDCSIVYVSIDTVSTRLVPFERARASARL